MQTLQALEKIMYRQTTRSRKQIARMIAARDQRRNRYRWDHRRQRHRGRRQ